MDKTDRKRKGSPTSAIVTQSNDLVSARYGLPLAEMRLLFTVISKIQPDDTKLNIYRIPIGEFADFLGVARGSAYTEMKKITKALVTRYVEINESGSMTQTTWVASAKYVNGTGVVEIKLHEDMIPHLLQLKNGNFTQCKLAMLLGFKSQYTLRLYTLLKMRRDHNPHAKSYEIELGELRKLLGVSIERIERIDKFHKAQEAMELYPEYPDFKRRVLEVAKKELGDRKGETGKGDISFEYDEIRQGRKVATISFRVFVIKRAELLPVNKQTEGQLCPIPDTIPSADLDFVTVLLSFVPEAHRAKKSVRTAIESAEKKHGFDYTKRNILYVNDKAAKNYAGYLDKALKGDFAHDWELDQQAAAKTAEEKAQKQAKTEERERTATEAHLRQLDLLATANPDHRKNGAMARSLSALLDD